MTQSTEATSDLTTRTDEPGPPGPVVRPDPVPRRPMSWWRNPWVVPWAIIGIGFVVYALPPYLTFDPARAKVPQLSQSFPHYQFLWAHIMFGSVAMLTAPLQLWPWLRQRYPAVHRTTGRVYVFAGALPAGLVALVISPFAFAPPGNAIAAILWLTTTSTAYWMARKRRYAQHRRWMAYSVALTYSIVWGRLLFKVLPHLPDWEQSDVPLTLETSTWVGWVINLLIAQWWLERTARKVSVLS